MILTSTVFDRSTRVSDRQTDGRAMAYRALSLCFHALKMEGITVYDCRTF